jgi:hypothetical protein
MIYPTLVQVSSVLETGVQISFVLAIGVHVSPVFSSGSHLSRPFADIIHENAVDALAERITLLAPTIVTVQGIDALPR